MSHYHWTVNDQLNGNRDPRRRDRSRSEIRRSTNEDTLSSTGNQGPSTSTNLTVDFLKTLGLNAQLIEALINANPPKNEQTEAPTVQQQQTVHNAQEFASFLSQSYGLYSSETPSTNRGSENLPLRNQIGQVRVLFADPRRRPASTVPTPSDSRSIVYPNPLVTNNNAPSIDESYKQFINSIDQTLLNDETRQRFQRIALLDKELDKLQRMHIELVKTIERHSRARTSSKDKDPLLKENENLQTELIKYLRTLKATIMNNYSLYMWNNQLIIPR